MANFSDLVLASDLWGYWGFSLWSGRGMKGVYRRVTFVKNAIVGEVCRYYADDYIIWSHHGKADRDHVFATCRPQPDLMSQRYLFVEEERALEKGRSRSFLLGLRGYVEIHTYMPGGRYARRLKDLAPLVDRALGLVRSRRDETGGGLAKES